MGNITLDAAVEVKEEELKEAMVAASDPEGFDGAPKSSLRETKKPPKVVKGEHRETGGVTERSIYKSLPPPNSRYATKDDECSPNSSAFLFQKVS